MPWLASQIVLVEAALASAASAIADYLSEDPSFWRTADGEKHLEALLALLRADDGARARFFLHGKKPRFSNWQRGRGGKLLAVDCEV